ncbi:IS3 family transposase [Kingella potus]|nr:IS3 family transposase [Kingella potus]UOP00149.1 IS3 family transposase [Kingella potus]
MRMGSGRYRVQYCRRKAVSVAGDGFVWRGNHQLPHPNPPDFRLAGKMLKGALGKLSPPDRPVLHSDQDRQYQTGFYQKQLQDTGLVQSMSCKGNCLDNAAMGSFFGTLESECFHTRKYASIAELETALHEYIHYYNRDRIKLKLKGPNPVQYRIQSLKTA